MLHTASPTLGHKQRWRRERGLVTFISPSDGLVAWIASFEELSRHCVIRQTESLYTEKNTRKWE